MSRIKDSTSFSISPTDPSSAAIARAFRLCSGQ
jgi:hypothetical protein